MIAFFEILVFFVFTSLNTYGYGQEPFWERTNGPWGTFNGRAYSIVNGTESKIFAGIENSGVYSSADFGLNWENINGDLSEDRITAVIVSTNGGIFIGTASKGVYRSMDGGNTWVSINQGLNSLRVRKLAINQAGQLFAGTSSSGAVYRSVDNGDNWVETSSGLPVIDIFSLVVSNDGDIFAGTLGKGVFRSVDNGDSWVEINSGLVDSSIFSILVKPDSTIFIGTFQNGVFRSNDYGENWIAINNGITNFTVRALAYSSNGWIFAGTDNGVYRSSDNGESWSQVNEGMTNKFVFSLYTDTEGNIYAGTFQSIFFSSNDGIFWIERIDGISETKVLSLATSPNDEHTLFAGTDKDGLFRSIDDGANWKKIEFGNGFSRVWSIIVIDDSTILAGTSSTGIFRSIDNGENWTQADSGFNGKPIRTLMKTTSGDIFAGTGGSGLFRSSNNGKSWSHENPIGSSDIYSIVEHPDGELFAATFNGLFMSNDDAASWIRKYNGFPSAGPIVWSIAIDSSGFILAGITEFFNNGIYRSFDKGDNWEFVFGELNASSPIVWSILINTEGIIFASTEVDGVLKFDGDTWTKQNEGLSTNGVKSLAINSGGLLFAGVSSSMITMKSGVFRSKKSTTSVKEQERELSESFILEQNFPNPFNPVTNLSYSLPHSGNVNLIIYNLVGEEVVRLVDGFKPAGEYKTAWNASSVSSGIYFYRLTVRQTDVGQARDFVQTRKMVLLK